MDTGLYSGVATTKLLEQRFNTEEKETKRCLKPMGQQTKTFTLCCCFRVKTLASTLNTPFPNEMDQMVNGLCPSMNGASANGPLALQLVEEARNDLRQFARYKMALESWVMSIVLPETKLIPNRMIKVEVATCGNARQDGGRDLGSLAQRLVDQTGKKDARFFAYRPMERRCTFGCRRRNVLQ